MLHQMNDWLSRPAQATVAKAGGWISLGPGFGLRDLPGFRYILRVHIDGLAVGAEADVPRSGPGFGTCYGSHSSWCLRWSPNIGMP